jgi:hypothetical protein
VLQAQVVAPAALVLPLGQGVHVAESATALNVFSAQMLQARVAALPELEKPALQMQVPAPDALALFDGHWVHELELLVLYEPAKQVEHAAPAVEKVPGLQAVQTSETPVPALAKPLRHAHVVAPAALVLPSGHAAHVAVPATGLYVPAVHRVQTRLAPLPDWA